MKKIFYTKEVSAGGKVKYVPVAEYDNDYLDSFPKGNHLVMCYPGGKSRRFNIDPDYAAMIAAGRVAEDAICDAIRKAAELRPAKTPITDQQLAAWKALAEAFGDELCTLNGLCIHGVAVAGVKAMQAEADKLLANPAVKKAYEHFQMICSLTREQESKV
jgi:hypothetical protein